MEDTFWSGLAVFVVSNYTVIVWIIVDLILILGPRNIGQLSYTLNRGMLRTHKSSEEGLQRLATI